MHTRLLRQAGGLSKHSHGVNEARGHVVFENKGKALRDNAEGTVRLSTRGVVTSLV